MRRLPQIRLGRTPGPDSAAGRMVWLGILLVIGQFVILLATQAVPLTARIWAMRVETALARSAHLAYGDEFTGYVLFLRRVIPDEALVVIPSHEADPVLGEMPFMQYFLFPRRLTNCPVQSQWSECVIHYGGPQTYLIAVGSFPPRSGLEGIKEYIAYDESRGVLAPRGEQGG